MVGMVNGPVIGNQRNLNPQKCFFSKSTKFDSLEKKGPIRYFGTKLVCVKTQNNVQTHALFYFFVCIVFKSNNMNVLK